MPSLPAPATSRLGPARLLLFALPWLPMAFIMMPLGMFIPAFYAKYTTATLAAIGVATGAARVVDAFADPLIGHLSDRTRGRFGARKPWVAAGTLLFALCVWQLFQPARDAGIAYYVVWSGGLYLAYACVEIPMRAWGSELSGQAVERARIFTAIGVMMALGSLLFWLAPPLADALLGLSDLNTPRGMSGVALAFTASFVLLVGATLAAVPGGRRLEAGQGSIAEMGRAVRHNRPFGVYVAGLSIWSVGNSAFTSLVFLLLSDHLKLGAAVAPMMITYFVVQLAVMPLWVRLLRGFDKHRLLAACWLLDAGVKLSLPLFEPGAVSMVMLYAVLVAGAVLGSISYTFPQAVLADVVDYDTLRSRRSLAASYFALNTLLYKVMMGLGSGFALSLLGGFGYTVGQAHDATACLGLMAAVSMFPGLCMTAAAAVMWRFPIDGRRQAVIARRLEALRRRSGATQAATSAG